jgi:hypothetical protein
LVAVNKGGLVLVIAGALVLCQVLGGNALTRLGIVGQGGDTAAAPEFPGVPDKGYSNVPHNAEGNPL